MEIEPHRKKGNVQRKKIESLIRELEFSQIYYDSIEAATQLGDIGSAANDAVPALVRALRDKDIPRTVFDGQYSSVRNAAVWALRKIRTPEAIMAVKQYEEGLLRWGNNLPEPYRIVRDADRNVLDDYGTVVPKEEIKANMRVGYRTGLTLGVAGIGFLIGKLGERADTGQPADSSQPANVGGLVTLIGTVIGHYLGKTIDWETTINNVKAQRRQQMGRALALSEQEKARQFHLQLGDGSQHTFSIDSTYPQIQPIHPFRLGLTYQIDLENENFSKGLRQKFLNHGFIFSQNVNILIQKMSHHEWMIVDSFLKVGYLVRKDDKGLNVYRGKIDRVDDQK